VGAGRLFVDVCFSLVPRHSDVDITKTYPALGGIFAMKKWAVGGY
jgi:hypothetical protein